MIAAARQFEQQMKMLQTAEQKEQAAAKLLAAAEAAVGRAIKRLGSAFCHGPTRVDAIIGATRSEGEPAMIRSLWISKTGMEAQQTQLDAISNNLANVATNGFKRGHAVFEDLMYQNLRQAGAASSSRRSCRPACRSGLGVRAGGDRAQLLAGQPAADRQQPRRRDQGQRLLPDRRCPTARPATRATARSRSTPRASS